MGAAWAPDGRTRAAFDFTLSSGRIIPIEVIADPESVSLLDVVLLE